ncbi:hypothetical protein Poli38472_006106 [Pythium oligandrum]|uniref:Uncharacterized protein n=1 Tax=Pythium oligandrum TaxID=41045 RepID=A0A8K1FSK5_PYTOL|nr:hypothetical protein Poli38472_006106 [Pythium oligandrum]|eukprot:TMW68638.1 hypothetical protein Poli38472_006106 [Pythium oligandrum]
MVKTLLVAMALVATASFQEANAHTYLTQPLAEFKKGASKSSWVDETGPPWEGTFKTGAQFAAEAEKRGIKDLRSFLEERGPVCGNSLPDATPKAIPSDGIVKFASTIEHAGPCEIWFDDNRAFYDEDCEKSFGTATSLKVDFSSCKGNCMMRFYWLGLQDGGKRWQAYKNCIPLKGGSGGSGPSPTSAAPSPSSSATPKPSATSTKPTKTPKPTTAAPKPTSGTPKPSNSTSKPIAPSPSKVTCLRRTRN